MERTGVESLNCLHCDSGGREAERVRAKPCSGRFNACKAGALTLTRFKTSGAISNFVVNLELQYILNSGSLSRCVLSLHVSFPPLLSVFSSHRRHYLKSFRLDHLRWNTQVKT